MSDYKWEQFYQFAESLVQSNSHTETKSRIATSRAYYAAYHQALVFAQWRDPGMCQKKVSHQCLIQWFLDKQSELQLQTIGQSLRTLKFSRVHADYQTNHFIHSKAKNDVIQAHNIIEAINTLSNN